MMTLNRKRDLFILLGGLCFFSEILFSDVQYYESGLGRKWEYSQSSDLIKVRQPESEAISAFFEGNFPETTRQEEWKEWKKVGDLSHSHRHYHCFYKGRRVDGVGLSIHYNRQGWIEYAESDLEKNISVDFKPDSSEIRNWLAQKIRVILKKEMGREFSSWQWEPLLWRDESHPDFLPAFEIEVVYENPRYAKYIIVDQQTAEILSDFKRSRSVDIERVDTTVKIFKNRNIDADGNDVAITPNITITTNDSTALANSNVHIYREQLSAGVYSRREISPFDYSTSFSTDPDLYSSSCAGDETTSTPCVNQAFDGVNVYYHLNTYRSFLNTYLTSLGDTTSFPDPLPVVINSQSINIGATSDNAFYVASSACGAGMDRCLLFLPPTGTCSSSQNCEIVGCSDGSVLNNLAREGFVIAHEYQHYITDIISGIEFTSKTKYAVGDALHEGYSDYGAVTYLSDLNAATITLGLVVIPACSGSRREVGDLRIYGETAEDSDPHLSGLSWASALWQLREEFGATIADRLAFKSLYFLGSNPGFVSSVESLVKADRALYLGVHIERIRQLLYTEVKFLGSAQEPFKDPLTLEAHVGFKGCAGVLNQPNNGSPSVSNLIFLVWGLITLMLGRFMAHRVAR